jgi:hypothetical protein
MNVNSNKWVTFHWIYVRLWWAEYVVQVEEEVSYAYNVNVGQNKWLTDGRFWEDQKEISMSFRHC